MQAIELACLRKGYQNMAAHENPFATRFIEPGALEYAFFENGSLDRLREQFFSECRSRAAIVGPHGSGKSTLLHSLVPILGRIESYRDLGDPESSNVKFHDERKSSDAKRVRWFRLSSVARDSNQVNRDRLHWHNNTILVVDGFEQMSFLNRCYVQWRTRRSGSGLLVTTHAKPMGLPVLWRTNVTQKSAEYVVRSLLKNRPFDVDRLLASPEWVAIRAKWKDNLREALFDMYDLVEDNRIS